MSIGIEVKPINPGKQQNAVVALGDYTTLAIQLRAALTTLADLKQRESEHAYMDQYHNTATYALNSDGSAGAGDAVPDSAHPMIGQSISADDVQGFVGYVVNDLYDFLTGVAGPTVADRRPAIFGMLP